MIKNFEKTIGNWYTFDFDGENHFVKKDGSDLRIKENRKCKRIDVNSIENDELKNLIIGMQVSNEFTS